MMTVRTFKVLVESLKVALQKFEETNGEIALPPGKMDEIANSTKTTPPHS